MPRRSAMFLLAGLIWGVTACGGSTTRPPDGPNDQSYGDEDSVLGVTGTIRSNPETGPAPKVLWAVDLGPEAMIVHDGVVYVTDLDAAVTAIDIATGEVAWSVQPDEGADTSGGVTMSYLEGAVRVFIPWSYAAELDAADGSTRSLDSTLGENPWPDQAAWFSDEPGYAFLEGWEPRIAPDDGEELSLVGRTPDGDVSFETTGEPMLDPLPYAFRVGSTVVIADQSGYVVGLDWP
ncbi:MAG TPA: PQQ-binding-like beta-propeller repeat protein [Microthrixaceae bacterium]|nr:PQQ-binding-like beta-propeller repeat protein [Microthrixaceae bacterium]